MADSIEHFHRQANQWHRHYRKAHFRDRLALFVAELRRVLPSNSRVLDFGCGPGVMAMACALSGYEVTGVDAAEGMVRIAEEECRRRRIVNLKCELVSSLTEESVFDAVICSSVLEYVPEDDRFVARLAAHVRPRGYLLISVPHSASLVGRAEDVIMRLGLRKGGGNAKADVLFARRRYARRRFIRMLSSHGFAVDRCRYYELPKLGHAGVLMSRVRCLGVMMLVVAQRLGS